MCRGQGWAANGAALGRAKGFEFGASRIRATRPACAMEMSRNFGLP